MQKSKTNCMDIFNSENSAYLKISGYILGIKMC